MWAKEFRPDPEKLNPRGGAIAIGHPLGASGVRLMTTMLNHLDATGGRFGFQTMCEGGGQANATVVERLADRSARTDDMLELTAGDARCTLLPDRGGRIAAADTSPASTSW